MADYTIDIDILGEVFTKLFNCASTSIDNPMSLKTLTHEVADNTKIDTLLKINQVYADLSETTLTGQSSFKENIYLIKGPEIKSIIDSVETDEDYEKLNDMSYAFYGCTNLKTIQPLSFAKSWAYAFTDCINLNDVSGTLKYAKETNNMFYNCTSLSNYSFDEDDMTYNINTSKMFYNCNNLKTIMKMPVNVQDVSYMYYNCNTLTDVDLTDYILPESITDMSGAFSYTNIEKSPHLLYSNYTIRAKKAYKDVFRNNENLKIVWLPLNIKDIYNSDEETYLMEYTGIYHECPNVNNIYTETIKDLRFSKLNWSLINDIFFDKDYDNMLSSDLLDVPSINSAELHKSIDLNNNVYTQIKYARISLELNKNKTN